MRVNWCLRVVEMTLSKASDTVVWELNELLAADRRAKAFSEASVAGELADRPLGFEACLLYTSPSPRDVEESRMPSSA